MSNISIEQKESQLVVDSRLVAEDLNVKHKNLLETIRKHINLIESRFGHLAFQTETVKNSAGAENQTIFCWLTEEQATFVMTLSRNSDRVVECKANLVEAFSKARKELQKQQPELPQTYSEALRKLADEWESHQQTKQQLKSAEQCLDTYRAILSPESCLDIKQVADALNVAGMGRNNLFKYLRSKKFIVKNDVTPYHNRVEQELAVVESKTVEIKGEKHTKQKTKLTFRGLEWLISNLEADGWRVDKTAKQVWDYYNAEALVS